MVLSLVPQKEPLVVIDEPATSGGANGDHFVERVVFHPSRGSIVCVKGDTLEELDVVTGALLCHITFDLLATSNLDLILPAGPHFVVGLLQSRLFVVWDLEEAVLLVTSDVDKVHNSRRVTALATSLCFDRWLFFNSEGSNNVRVTRVDSQRPSREILRKSPLRGGSVVSLAYSTEHHLLSSGCNDGTIQVWSILSDEGDAGASRKGQETTDFATPLFAVQLVQSPVVEITIGLCTGCGANGSSSNLFLAAGYQNRRVDVIAMNGQAHTCVASTTLNPPQTLDFSRLSGTLSLTIHGQLPVLLAHWRSFRREYGVDAIAVMGSIFLDAHKWEDFLGVFLAHDPALEEYVVAIDSDGAAKLPSRMGPTARRFRQLAVVFESIGQPDWAMRCLDLSGDDEALMTMIRKFSAASTPSSSEVLDSLQKSWAKLNPPLSAITKAAMGQMQQNAGAGQHDPFSILCCETLTQPMRRGRLLNSVAPLDRLKLSVAPTDKLPHQDDGANDTMRAGTLAWKRLAPEDASEWLGVSAKARLATTEPRALNYSIFAVEAAAVAGSLLGGDAGSTPAAFIPSASSASADAAASAKMTIGPFQDEEDAVVAYWRFEEGAAAIEKQTSGEAVSPDGIECLDTSKRENTLRLLGGAVNLVESTAPVDRGEPGRIPEEFALRFPSSETSSSALPPSGWGAQCPIRPGSTLDVGTVFDEDPYRREFTFEVWIRNYRLYAQVQKLLENDEEVPATMSGGVRQVLLSRRRVDSLDDGVKGGDVMGPASWELVIDEDDFLVLTFGSQQVRASQKMEHSGNQGWRHVAFTLDVSSPQRVGLKLYLDARCVGESQTTPSNQTVSKPSKLLLGWRMQDYEMTEVRLWATARSLDQLSDMRENYLGLAEAKRRMKIAIHQRNCTCEKCVSRRAQSSAGTAAGGPPRLGLSLSTPLAPPSRQRRVVPQAKPT
ncbi:WD40/YVTN repeat-like-containing domain [Phytophthora cinnamomi]|uniref:WD40/YVTN repeat-like-containing domain n=1 Tax=Phytophthora cinnamomi TaxID=4785 RepID=UPI0035596CAA|nr:WD40/YVTN repeat-like-containing domain [Phytophthora cinnamomi]